MTFAMALVILSTTAAATPYVIPVSKADWTCYDYSVDYHNKHSDWGMVTIGGRFFKTDSHIVNYKILNNGETLLIHDGLNNAEFPCYAWYKTGQSYHFWVNGEKPVRTYKYLKDNRDVILKNK